MRVVTGSEWLQESWGPNLQEGGEMCTPHVEGRLIFSRAHARFFIIFLPSKSLGFIPGLKTHVFYLKLVQLSRTTHDTSHASYPRLHAPHPTLHVLSLRIGARADAEPNLRKRMHRSRSLRSSMRTWHGRRPSRQHRCLPSLPLSNRLSM